MSQPVDYTVVSHRPYRAPVVGLCGKFGCILGRFSPYSWRNKGQNRRKCPFWAMSGKKVDKSVVFMEKRGAAGSVGFC